MNKKAFIILLLILVVILIIFAVKYGFSGVFWKPEIYQLNKAVRFEPMKMDPSLRPTTMMVPPTLPVVRLLHDGAVYDGVESGYCWPSIDQSTGDIATLCIEREFLVPEESIHVEQHDTIMVKIDTHRQPVGLIADIFTSSDQPPLESIPLESKLSSPLSIDLKAGVYIIQIAADWPEGDVRYTFKIGISPNNN